MDYRLKVFMVVAESLGITKASHELHLSQPAVTKHIKLLEEEVGHLLLHRSASGVRLTEAGALLLQHARLVARLDDEVIQRIRQHHGTLQGELKLGATSTIGQYLLPQWLVRSRQRWPELRLTVSMLNTEETLAAIRENRLDLALVEGNLQRAKLPHEPFSEDELLCLCAPQHPMSHHLGITLAQLAEQAWIFREPGSGTRDVVESALKKLGIKLEDLKVDLELSSSEAIKAVVAASHGLTFLSRFAVERELAVGTLNAIKVKGLTVTRQLSFVYPTGPKPVGAVRAFMDLVRQSAWPGLPGDLKDGKSVINIH